MVDAPSDPSGLHRVRERGPSGDEPTRVVEGIIRTAGTFVLRNRKKGGTKAPGERGVRFGVETETGAGALARVAGEV
jgi:hypothetical protein